MAVSALVAAPATAVTVDQTDVPQEAEAGSQISASFTLTDLYQDPQWEPWTLEGETELTNVTWTLTFIDPQGNEFHTETYNGQTFSQQGISTDHPQGTITEIRVQITGDVPSPDQFTYPEKETFTLAKLTQISGQEGAHNEINTWDTHHYTVAEQGNPDASPGSKDAREALNSAREAINETEEAGGDVSSAEETLKNAISAYENGNFQNAVSLAEDAKDEAENAKQSKEQSQMLLFGGVGLVVVLLIAGGVWYYRQQQDDYDKLG
ncbi:hypothetical protein BRC81_11010 [Halobacteriales archaeon QS_1_68_20]|nr:MAG: hypothetical protein BRC81_11010 [Halobacteriales archaeon QS_1_68_20]